MSNYLRNFYIWCGEHVINSWFTMHTPVAQFFVNSLLKMLCIIIAVAYFTIAERKVMAAIQRRKGPNVIGLWGLLQPVADGAKLLLKELVIPTRSNKTIFLLAPLMVLILSIVSWSIVPSMIYTPNINGIIFDGWENYITFFRNVYMSTFSGLKMYLYSILLSISVYLNFAYFHVIQPFANINYGVLFILAISGLNVYGIVIAGWASNSKYAFLGSLRSSAQMISYEVSLSLLILPVILLAGSLNWGDIITAQQQTGWFVFPLFPCTVLFFISMLAETNRAPFDLPEAEAELVAGYNVEYSSIIFAMFFLGEYSNMLLMSTVIVMLFFGGWLAPFSCFKFLSPAFWFSLKTLFFCFLFILVRAALPRYRYDQLMDLGWKTFLPFSLAFFVFVVGLLIACHSLPFITWTLTYTGYIYTENIFFLR